jgi:hypothetical protein
MVDWLRVDELAFCVAETSTLDEASSVAVTVTYVFWVVVTVTSVVHSVVEAALT